MHDQMTHRERILAAIDRKPVDKIPLDYWGTGEMTTKLMKALGAEDEMQLWGILGLDKIIGAGASYVGPELKSTEGNWKDIWGVEYKPVSYANNEGAYLEIARSPIKDLETIDQIEANYTWPKLEWFNFSQVKERCLQHPQYAIESGYIAPLYMYTNIRGMEQTLMDLAADEEVAEYIIDRICDFLYDYHQRLFEAADGHIDIAQVTDDFGTQNGLMISLDMFDRYFKRHYERFIKLLKSYNIRVFHHDDGAIMPLIPRLVDLGIDILNPIQWHLPGMDLKELKSRFGKQLCFHGGIDNQHVLPFGTTEEVKQEVRTCMEILGGDGTGYILAPCHMAQVITPVKNIVTMYRKADEIRSRR